MTNLPAPPIQQPLVVQRTNGLAIAALVCGLTGFMYLVPAVLGIVFGVVARRQIRTSPVPSSGSGMALAGIILGCAWIGLVLAVIASALASA